MKNIKFNNQKLTVLIFTFFLTACGGGGDDSSSSTTTDALESSEITDSPETTIVPDTIVTPETSEVTSEWRPGFYPDQTLFKDYCESPRTSSGTETYADKQGSSFTEKMWLRSWSNDIYLWYREITDTNPDLISSPQDYFDTQKTSAVTASGVAKDQFHFYTDTASYNEQVSGGGSLGYGMTLDFISTVPPRKLVVKYVEPGSPADLANISRGDELVSVDGADLINGNDIDTLNNGLLPTIDNESHTFGVIPSGESTSRTVSMAASVVVEEPVKNTQYFTHNDTGERVGYLTFNTFGTFTAEESLVNSFEYLSDANVSDLVLDLRYNGGGFLAISSQLAYMIAGKNNTENRTFYKTEFNDKYPNTDPFTGESIFPYPFIDTGLDFSVSSSVDLPTLNLNRVYVLTSESTCSASEALINGLKGIGVEVIQIGGKTCGKPYGFRGTDNCGTTYFTVMFRGINEEGFGDYADGFYPANSSNIGSVAVQGCEVTDNYSYLLGDLDEPMLQAALGYREYGTCPATSASRTASRPSTNLSITGENDLLNDKRLRSKLMLKNSLLFQ